MKNQGEGSGLMFRRILLQLSGLMLLVLLAAHVAEGKKEKESIIGQKRELEQINQEITQSRKLLDSLQNTQTSLQKHISEYDQRIESDRKVIGRLTRELDQLKKEISIADSMHNDRQGYLDRCQRRYLGNLRHFYMAAAEPPVVFSDEPNDELDLQRKITYLTALAGFESDNVREASVLLNESVVKLDSVSGRRHEISGLKKQRETSYALGTSQKEKQVKNLDQVRRRSMVEADRVMTLEQAAEEMASIIARLEEERTSSPQRPAGEGQSVFATLKGRLPSPFRGKIILAFGPSKDKITGLRSYSPGISIKGRAGNSVTSVASGMVAYAGNLRGYGNFVIINHDGEYYTTYAGLGSVLVSENQYLQAGAKIGTAGDDGIVKFELRQGREPLDPVTWITIEAF